MSGPVFLEPLSFSVGKTPSLHHERSYAAFLRELPTLLAEHSGQWVAYAGEVQLGIHASKRELYRQCIATGHRDGEFLICGIEPPQEVVLDDLLDV